MLRLLLVYVFHYLCVVQSKQEPVYSAPQTHTHTHLTRNYICSHIYQDFIITTLYYIVFYHLIIHNSS